MKNYYNILGVPENASDKMIAEAYRKLAIKFHPDKNQGDPFFVERFKQVNEAYQILGKATDKKEYDDQLFNYSDSYEILKQQQDNEFLKRPVNRKRIRSSKKSNYSWLMIGFVALACASVLLWLKDSDSKGFTPTTVYTIKQITSPEGVEFAGNLPKPIGVNVASTVNHSIKNNAFDTPLKTHITSKKTPLILTEKQRIPLEGRKLQSSEIDKIISELQKRKSNKSIRITQSLNSDIRRDFAIVPILQKNGFTIAGREYTSQNFNGIQINEKSDFFNLIIGRTAKNDKTN